MMARAKSVQTAAICSVFLFLVGCTVPGSNLTLDGKAMGAQVGTEADINQLTAVYPITPLLLAQLRQATTYGDKFSPSPAAKSQYRYRIGAGDVLNIRVWNHPELNEATVSNTAQGKQVSSGTWVDETGHIFYPLVGKVYVQGKTLPEAQALMTQRLARYLKQPQVDMNIAEFRSQNVTVAGAVKQGGQQAITNVPLTLLDAIGQAGGFTELADTNRIKWTRQGVDRTVSLQDILSRGDTLQNALLVGGDIVYVPPREDVQVYVMGEVGKQSVLTMGNNGLNLTEALGKAEGMSQNLANATGVFVIRNEPLSTDEKPIHVYQLNLADATAYAWGTQFALKPDDVVYVTAAPVVRWNRVLSQITPSLSSMIMLNNTFK